MNIGLFIPIGNNGWLISRNSPQYMPSFDLNRRVALMAEGYGLDFLLSMIKLRGYGGETEFWDHNLESFTLMAGLAAVTQRIQLFATASSLILPPAFMARMATTIDSIAPGRFGVNLITGWQRPEYSQMGLWPGDEHFAQRYDQLEEYTRVLLDLWEKGQSDFKGDFFQMDDCRLSPRPSQPIKIVCAGQSQRGLQFMARHADYNFCIGKGINTPRALDSMVGQVRSTAEAAGRQVPALALFTIIAAETDEAAFAKWEHYKAGADLEALDWMARQAGADKHSGSDTNVRQYTLPETAVAHGFGLLIGSYASVARMMDELDEVPGLGGVMLTFDDFITGLDAFGQHIQPLMKSRRHITAVAP